MLKSIKKLSALLLCIALVLSCIGCAGKGSGTNNGTNSGTSNGTSSSTDTNSDASSDNGNGSSTGNNTSEDLGASSNTSTNVSSAKLISKYADTITGVFDEKNIVLTFAALSDTHLAGNEQQYQSSYDRFTKAINSCEKFATTKKLDAICIAGDVGNCTNSPANVIGIKDGQTIAQAQAEQGKIERENFLRAILDAADPATKLFYCLGNHDGFKGTNAQLYIDSFSGKNKQYYNRFYGDDLDKEALVKGNRHVKINGYNFLALEAIAEGKVDADGYAWLESKIKSIIAEDPKQTIFLFHHYPPTSLAFATAGQNSEIRKVLEKYPQVIIFAGHIHAQIDFDNTIMQSDKGYIAVNCGSVKNINETRLVTIAGDTALNVKNSDMAEQSQGMVVEVDKSGNVRISRYNFVLGKKIASSFVIPAVKKDGTRSLDYTKDRKNKTSAPEFISNNISAEMSGTNIKLTFPAAACPTQKVYRYEVTVTNTSTNQKSKVQYVSSLFYKYATPADMPKEYSVTFNPGITMSKGTYKIEVIAVDSWPLKSKPLTYQLVVK